MSASEDFEESLLDAILDGQVERLAGVPAADRLIGLVGSPRSPAERGAPEPLPSDELEGAGFRAHGLLGSGAHASVYAAEDLTLGREVALKVVHAAGADPAARRTFLREARTLARIDHPNVVRIWSADARGDRLLLALERIEGETLRERLLREGPLPPRLAARVALDVARGLAAVHAAGILHRDLNPGNVMLRPDDRAVLLDFSLARSDASERLQRGGTIGSPAYEAPEVLAGGEPDERSDVYALGMLLVWMVSGRVPLRGATWAELRRSAISGERTPIAELAPEVPRGLRNIVERAVGVRPDERIQDADRLARELGTFLRRRHRLALAVAGLTVVSMFVVAGLELRDGIRSAAKVEQGNAARREAQLRDQAKRDLDQIARIVPPVSLGGLAETWDWNPREHGFDGLQVRVPEDKTTLQAAILAAGDRGVVYLARGAYPGSIEIMDLSIAIVSADGPGAAILVGSEDEGSALVVHTPNPGVPRDVVVRGLSITGGLGRRLSERNTDRGDLYGGGVFVQGADLRVRLEACAIWGNGGSGTTFGGGLAVRDSLDGDGGLMLERCLVVGNAAWASGGGILADNARVHLVRCTVSDNASGEFRGIQGGIGLAIGALLTLEDSIVWGNYGAQIGGYEGLDSAVLVHERNCLVEGVGGLSLTEADLFVATPRSDWRLRPGAVEALEGAVPGALPAWTGSESELPLPSASESWPRRLRASPAGVRGLGALPPTDLPSGAVVLHVPSDYSTIQDALDDAPSGAWIVVAPGLYREALQLGGRSLTLLGELGADATVIEFTFEDLPVVDIHASESVEVRLRGLTIRGGVGRLVQGIGHFGGALAVRGPVDLQLEGVAIWESGVRRDTLGGGALWATDGASVSARHVLFARNHAIAGGSALFVDDAAVRLEDCTLVGDGAPSAALIHVTPRGRLTLLRSVLWAGPDALVFEPQSRAQGQVAVTESIVEGGWDGPGVLDLDPGFVDPAHDDWSPAPGGPAHVRGWGVGVPQGR